jgi:hypothetical protein
MRRLFAHTSPLQKLVRGVGVGVIVGVIVGIVLNLLSQRHYVGPPIKIDRVIDERDSMGDTWVFADALHLSSPVLASINAPLKIERERGFLGNLNPYDYWAIDNGGVDPAPAMTRIVLEGNRSDTVEILGIQANARCERPLNGTIFYSPPAGVNPVASMGFNLDVPDPIARKVTSGYVLSGPYFATTTISLAPGEHQVIDMVAVTRNHFCHYTLTLKILDGGKISTEMLDDGGKQFEVSALYKGGSSSIFSHYRSVYIGGVVTPNGLFTPVSPHYRLFGISSHNSIG